MKKFHAGKNFNQSIFYKSTLILIQVGATELALSLAVIFNQAIRNGEWIAKLKRGEWIPVHKKDDKQRDTNYRPITVLSCINKVY